MRVFTWFAAALCAVLVSAPLAASPLYTVTALGDVEPRAINAGGQVTGDSRLSSGYVHAFRWTNGTTEDLGTLGGAQSQAFAINRSGIVAGAADTSTIGIFGVQDVHAAVWDAAGIHDLGTLGGPWSWGQGINNLGRAVGSAEIADWPYTQHAFLWDSAGGMRDLGTLQPGGGSCATGINDSGLIVGLAFPTPATEKRACYWDNGGIHALDLLPGYAGSDAQAVNDAGLIVGNHTWLSTAGGEHTAERATLWDRNGAHDLGTLGGAESMAYAINSLGQIVGTSQTGSLTYFSDAFLFQDGVMYNLNDLVPDDFDWKLVQALGINDNGQIVALGRNAQLGEAFLLTPVPEPSSLLALLCGLGGMAGIIRYRRR